MGNNIRDMLPVSKDTKVWVAMAGSFFASAFVYSFISGVGRAIQLSNYLQAGGSDAYVLVSPILVGVMKAIGFFAAASIFCKNTGGLVFHMQYVASYITFYVAENFNLLKKWQKGTKCNMATSMFYVSAGEVINMWSALAMLAVNSVAMLVGYFLGTLLIGAAVQYPDRESYQVLAQAPGVFPGFTANNPPATYDFSVIENIIPRAFVVEIICTALLGLYFTFVGLNITRRGEKGKITQEKQDSQHSKAVRGGALLVFATNVIAQNVSGSSFDLAHWVSSNFATSLLADEPLFDGGVYDNSESYWYVYVFGNLIGWVTGSVIAYIVFGFVFKEELKAGYEPVADAGGADGGENSNVVSEGRNRGRQTRARVNDILAGSDLFGNN